MRSLVKHVTAAFFIFGAAVPALASHNDVNTTFAVGQVVVTDDHILDVSGLYTLTDGSSTVTLLIIQDDRGRLNASTTITLANGTFASPVFARGHLQLTGQVFLRIQLEG